jgi:hypothetical protein
MAVATRSNIPSTFLIANNYYHQEICLFQGSLSWQAESVVVALPEHRPSCASLLNSVTTALRLEILLITRTRTILIGVG